MIKIPGIRIGRMDFSTKIERIAIPTYKLETTRYVGLLTSVPVTIPPMYGIIASSDVTTVDLATIKGIFNIKLKKVIIKEIIVSIDANSLGLVFLYDYKRSAYIGIRWFYGNVHVRIPDGYAFNYGESYDIVIANLGTEPHKFFLAVHGTSELDPEDLRRKGLI